jgi:pimeloyl-ACP methyl ester carboxylesterase
MVERLVLRGAGVDLVADAEGREDGQPILFLHGGGQTRHSWRRAVREAARHGLRGISVDQRGHGESDWSPDGRYGLDMFAADVRAIVERLAKPPIMVGASMGGLAGMMVAADPPPACRALVLVDITARIEEEGAREIGDFMGSAAGGFASLEEAADAVAAYLPHRERPKDASGLARNLRLRDDGRYHWHWDPAFLRMRDGDDSGAPDPELLQQAARALELPVLLIRGGRSRIVSEDGAREFLEMVPHARFVDIADADHMVAGDANDAFNAAVFSFVDAELGRA